MSFHLISEIIANRNEIHLFQTIGPYFVTNKKLLYVMLVWYLKLKLWHIYHATNTIHLQNVGHIYFLVYKIIKDN